MGFLLYFLFFDLKLPDIQGMSTNIDITFEILKHIDDYKTIVNVLLCDSSCYSLKRYFNKSRMILLKYQVKFTDPGNFIFKAKGVEQSAYRLRDGSWDYDGLVELYMKHFERSTIECDMMEITSFPVYPKMSIFIGRANHLTEFPVQPKMTEFYGPNNNLTEFPVQPKMKYFHGSNNNLTEFPVQPKLSYFHSFLWQWK